VVVDVTFVVTFFTTAVVELYLIVVVKKNVVVGGTDVVGETVVVGELVVVGETVVVGIMHSTIQKKLWLNNTLQSGHVLQLKIVELEELAKS